jgi:hypothetical protein
LKDWIDGLTIRVVDENLIVLRARRDNKPNSAFEPSTLDNVLSVLLLHPLAETMRFHAMADIGLICALQLNLFLLKSGRYYSTPEGNMQT